MHFDLTNSTRSSAVADASCHWIFC